MTHLLPRCGRLVAYEIDARMAARLPPDDRLSVRTEDFLAAKPPPEEFALVGKS